MTTGFQMESLARREPVALRRWLISLKRAGYILGIAFLFRLTNYLGSLPGGSLQEITKVDILNCMGVGMAVFAAAALFDSANRVRFALAAALAIAAAAPVLAHPRFRSANTWCPSAGRPSAGTGNSRSSPAPPTWVSGWRRA